MRARTQVSRDLGDGAPPPAPARRAPRALPISRLENEIPISDFPPVRARRAWRRGEIGSRCFFRCLCIYSFFSRMGSHRPDRGPRHAQQDTHECGVNSHRAKSIDLSRDAHADARSTSDKAQTSSQPTRRDTTARGTTTVWQALSGQSSPSISRYIFCSSLRSAFI